MELEGFTDSPPKPRNLDSQMDDEDSIQKRGREHTGLTPSATKKRPVAPKSKVITKRDKPNNRNSAGQEPVNNSRDRDRGKKPTTHDGSSYRIPKKTEYQRSSTIELPMGSMPGPNRAEVPTPEKPVPLEALTSVPPHLSRRPARSLPLHKLPR